MTTKQVGTFAAASAPTAHIPAHYLRRLARIIVLRAALRGRITWPVALPLLAWIAGGAA